MLREEYSQAEEKRRKKAQWFKYSWYVVNREIHVDVIQLVKRGRT